MEIEDGFLPESPTKQMRFDCLGVKKGIAWLKHFPELDQIKSWHSIPFTNTVPEVKIMKYVVLVYSKDSILNTIPRSPLMERKLKACALAGFKKDSNGEFEPSIRHQVIALDVAGFVARGGKPGKGNRARAILEMIIDFLILQNNWTWSKIIAVEENMQRLLKEYMNPLDLKKATNVKQGVEAQLKKGEYLDVIEKDEKRLDKLYTELFNSDVEIKAELNGRIEMTEERKRSSIEGWARLPVGT